MSEQLYEEIYQEILTNVDFTAMDKFEALIRSSITRAIITGEDNPAITSISFKFGQLLEGLNTFANSKGKDQVLTLGTQSLMAVTNALQFDLDDSEAFLLFHLRTLGKFRKKESELLAELKKLWVQFPDYQMEDREFSRALKNLMREKFIEYRKGNLYLNPAFVLRFREK